MLAPLKSASPLAYASLCRTGILPVRFITSSQARCLFYVIIGIGLPQCRSISNITLHSSGFKSQKILYNRIKYFSQSISSTTSGFILIMSSRDRIRKNGDSKSNSQSNIDHLLGRPFSNGSLPRYGGLPQTRPFTPPQKN